MSSLLSTLLQKLADVAEAPLKTTPPPPNPEPLPPCAKVDSLLGICCTKEQHFGADHRHVSKDGFVFEWLDPPKKAATMKRNPGAVAESG